MIIQPEGSAWPLTCVRAKELGDARSSSGSYIKPISQVAFIYPSFAGMDLRIGKGYLTVVVPALNIHHCQASTRVTVCEVRENPCNLVHAFLCSLGRHIDISGVIIPLDEPSTLIVLPKIQLTVDVNEEGPHEFDAPQPSPLQPFFLHLTLKAVVVSFRVVAGREVGRYISHDRGLEGDLLSLVDVL